MASLAFNEMF